MNDVSVVIVTYRSRAVVLDLLAALERHAPTAEVVVVDNASADGTPELVAASFPRVRVVRRAANGGVSAGLNEGVRHTTRSHVAFLNPDIRFDSDVLSPLSAYLAAHPDVGVVAPKLLNPDGSVQLSCRSFPGYSAALFNRYSLLTRLFPANRASRRYLMSDFDHTTVRDVDWVSGAALMFPRTVFDRVGGWDEHYFLFSEDVDFCREVHAAGYRVVYDPDVAMHHAIGISKGTSSKLIIERHRSMWRYYKKHLRGNMLQDAVTGAGIAGRCAYLLAAAAARRMRERR